MATDGLSYADTTALQAQIDRLTAAKNDIATAITNKGVTVPSGTKLDGMAALIGSIESGGSGGGSEWIKLSYDDMYDLHETLSSIRPPMWSEVSGLTNLVLVLKNNITILPNEQPYQSHIVLTRNIIPLFLSKEYEPVSTITIFGYENPDTSFSNTTVRLVEGFLRDYGYYMNIFNLNEDLIGNFYFNVDDFGILSPEYDFDGICDTPVLSFEFYAKYLKPTT